MLPALSGPGTPPHAGSILAALILAAGVANLNLAIANVALPSIGLTFAAPQTAIDLVAAGFALGMAGSVLWIGAIADRHGRRAMLLLGIALSIPAGIAAAIAPSVDFLVGARVAGGIAAGMTYPTSLALVTALWAPGRDRTHAIALWSGLGGSFTALAPLVSGILLERFAWGSVFVVTIPVAALALVVAWRVLPAHVNETTRPVDHLGGILSMVAVGSLVLAINYLPTRDHTAIGAWLGVAAVVAIAAFVLRQRRAPDPILDLHVAARRLFWVPALAGMILTGSLFGCMLLGQLYMQNVLGYTALEAGVAILPIAVLMVVLAPVAARLVDARGSRFTLLAGFAFLVAAYLAMLLLWHDPTPFLLIVFTFALIGTGLGLGGTPAFRSIMGSSPVRRAGMGSATADIQRDLGGAITQSVYGALLTMGFATTMASRIATSPEADQVTAKVAHELELSYASAAAVAQRYPAYADAIVSAAKVSTVSGSHTAHVVGILLLVAGAALVWVAFPRREREHELLAAYHAEDAVARSASGTSAAPAAAGGG